VTASTSRTWGDRRLLVESHSLDAFLALKEAPQSMLGVFLRAGDEARSAVGRPALVQVEL